MSHRTPRYDVATIEQAVLTLLVEMRALIKVFERKGFLRPGEVSGEILTMRNLAATTIRRRRGCQANGKGAARPPLHSVSRDNGDGECRGIPSRADNGSDG
jgi:hypothetical protein